MTLYHDIAGKQVQTTIPLLKNDSTLFDQKIRSFLDAIKEGKPAPVPTSQIIYNQAILSGIATSAKLGHEIEVDIPKF